MLKRTVATASSISTCLKLFSLSLLLLLLAMLQIPSVAQVLYGSLTGNVTDPSGAVLAGAKVEARNVNTGTVQEATTDGNGIYRFLTVLPGTYTITITAAGFDNQENQNVLVAANAVRRVDIAAGG